MDVSYLKSNSDKLIEHLKNNNYQRDALRLTKRCINLVLTLGPNTESYAEIFNYEVKRRGYMPNEQRCKALRCSLH